MEYCAKYTTDTQKRMQRMKRIFDEPWGKVQKDRLRSADKVTPTEIATHGIPLAGTTLMYQESMEGNSTSIIFESQHRQKFSWHSLGT